MIEWLLIFSGGMLTTWVSLKLKSFYEKTRGIKCVASNLYAFETYVHQAEDRFDIFIFIELHNESNYSRELEEIEFNFHTLAGHSRKVLLHGVSGKDSSFCAADRYHRVTRLGVEGNKTSKFLFWIEDRAKNVGQNKSGDPELFKQIVEGGRWRWRARYRHTKKIISVKLKPEWQRSNMPPEELLDNLMDDMDGL